MDSKSELLRRISALERDIEAVLEAISSDKLESKHLDAERQKRIVAEFKKELQIFHSVEIDKLRDDVSKAESLESSWKEFVRIDDDCRRLFNKCLTFVQGALVRSANMDRGIGLLADRLLNDLSTYAGYCWKGFTLLETGFFQDTADIIKVRFPDTSIWSLPLVAHEFGHFLGPELEGGGKRPFADALQNLDERNAKSPNWFQGHSQEWHHLQERFADMFAAVSLGPAFAWSFILHLPPVNADSGESLSHPSNNQRVYSILLTLEQMNEAAGSDRPYEKIIKDLREYWTQSLEKTKQKAWSELKERNFSKKVDLCYKTITLYTDDGLPYSYDGWLQAKKLVETLQKDDLPPDYEAPQELTRRDVLNAAWFCRLFVCNDRDPDDIAAQAKKVYELIS